MNRWRFAPTWKHSIVRLDTVAGVRVVVGEGEPASVDVLNGTPPVLPTPYEAKRRRSPRLSERAVFTHALTFASIQSEEQVLDFARHYGLLGLNMREGKPYSSEGPNWRVKMAESLQPPTFEPEPVSEWLRWVERVRFSFTETHDGHGPIIAALDAWVSVELNDEPRLRIYSDGPVIVHRRLLSALLTQTALDLAGFSTSPVSCPAKNCGRWFIPVHTEAAYCSETCRRREQNRRSYQRRKTRQKEDS